MIESIEFKNFKVLRNATLPLGKFTLIVGPNGSGKSTVFKAIEALADRSSPPYDTVVSAGSPDMAVASVKAFWANTGNSLSAHREWGRIGIHPNTRFEAHRQEVQELQGVLLNTLRDARQYSLNPQAIAEEVYLDRHVEMDSHGKNLPVILDRLRDTAPERFEALNDELGKWLPEFDRLLFETPNQGTRALLLRTRSGGHAIKAADLSEGTLIALAILTLAYLPKPPPLVCFEEPDHGLHPRLLRDVRDAIYRLAYPESFGEKRDPVQVIATTHNPYFLDLFREHPEEIVIAEKNGLEATFSRLVDRTDLTEILGEANLGEVWYSGVLGGVPAGT